MKKRNKSRIFDLFNPNEWEVKATIICTCLFIGALFVIRFYQSFENYESALTNLIICFIGALIGLLGFSLSGISIIVSLFSREETNLISDINGEEKIAFILSSYVFLAKNIGIQCITSIVLYFFVLSKISIAPIYLFYTVTIIEVYHVLFIIFYTVALVKNCVELYKIKNIYNRIQKSEKTLHDTVNEIKIDYIFSTMINNYDCTKDEVIDKLLLFVQESDMENAEVVIKYIKKQYCR